jgi:hypothetical protein
MGWKPGWVPGLEAGSGSDIMIAKTSLGCWNPSWIPGSELGRGLGAPIFGLEPGYLKSCWVVPSLDSGARTWVLLQFLQAGTWPGFWDMSWDLGSVQDVSWDLGASCLAVCRARLEHKPKIAVLENIFYGLVCRRGPDNEEKLVEAIMGVFRKYLSQAYTMAWVALSGFELGLPQPRKRIWFIFTKKAAVHTSANEIASQIRMLVCTLPDQYKAACLAM